MSTNATSEITQVRRTRKRKDFPITPFEETMSLAKAILGEGVDGQLRRLTVFDRLNRRPDSGSSRQLITDSGKYGLTVGSYNAEYLKITEEGRVVLSGDSSAQQKKKMEFELSILRFPAFRSIYERLEGQKIPAFDVLADQFETVPVEDRKRCAEVFLSNVRMLGAIKPIAGQDRLIHIGQVLEDLPIHEEGSENGNDHSNEMEDDKSVDSTVDHNTLSPMSPNPPALHLDINIHIDSTASSEQIESVFSSMARHLYGRESK